MPITVCSKHNFDFVKSLGAVEAFDYRGTNCVDQVKKYVGNDKGLSYVFDTVSTSETAEFCGRLVAPGAWWAYVLMGTQFPRDDVKKIYPLAYLSAGESIKKGTIEIPASQHDLGFVSEWAPLVENLLQHGLLKPHPHQAEQGLEKILDGLELMRSGKVSGKKLVYTV